MTRSDIDAPIAIHAVCRPLRLTWRIFEISLLATLTLPAQTRQITIDAAKPLGPHSQMPLMSIGAGRAADGLRPDWQAQLATLQQEIGFRYLRVHGILDDDIGIYTEDSTGKPVYNFEKLDTLYDFLQAHHLKPFVELSFMPSALASGTQTIFAYNANVTRPKDMAKWQALIQTLVQHCVARYGAPEVESWYFELWNEPDFPSFFAGTMDDYNVFYRATALALKGVCPACRIGGPAILTPFIAPFIQYLAKTQTPADFLSVHAYGVLKIAADAQGRPGAPLDPSPLSIIRTIRAVRLVTDRSALPTLPVHLTEWSSSFLPDDPFHDQYGSASFLLSKIKGSAPYAATMAYWTFSDIFSERGPQTLPFSGGFGLLTAQGIRKPTFFAYKFLSQLGTTDLTSTDPGESWVTTTPGKTGPTIQALIWDYTPLTPPAGVIDQTFYNKEIPAPPVAPVDLTIDHLPPGRYTEQVFRIGRSQNDPYTAYLQLGSPTQLTPAQLAELQSHTTNAPAENHLLTIKNQPLHQQFRMSQNDVLLILITPKSSSAPSPPAAPGIRKSKG